MITEAVRLATIWETHHCLADPQKKITVHFLSGRLNLTKIMTVDFIKDKAQFIPNEKNICDKNARKKQRNYWNL